MQDDGGWVELAPASAPRDAGWPVRRRRILVGAGLLALLLVALVTVGGLVAARQLAEEEAAATAASTTSLLSTAVIAPVLSDSLVRGTVGQTQSAREALDEVVRGWILGTDGVVRVKLSTEAGVIVYSDEAELIGRTSPLDRHDRATLRAGGLDAHVVDSDAAGERFDDAPGTLLVAYRGVETPGGTKLLVEVLFDYDRLTERSGQVWLRFAGITIGVIAVLVVLLGSLLGWLLSRLAREEAARREELRVELQLALGDAADDRRRLAESLRDGLVHELTGTALALSAASRELSQTDPVRSRLLATSARHVRDGLGGLRTLLIDLHPATLSVGALAPALDDLAARARNRGLTVRIDVPDRTGLDADEERLVFRVARECFANTMAHAHAGHLALTLHGRLLEIVDDGVGFELGSELGSVLGGTAVDGAERRRSGLQILVDAAHTSGASLSIRTAPAQGVRVRLRLP